MHHKSWVQCHQEPSSGAVPSHGRKAKASVGAIAHTMLRGSAGQHTETDTQRQLAQDPRSQIHRQAQPYGRYKHTHKLKHTDVEP